MSASSLVNKYLEPLSAAALLLACVSGVTLQLASPVHSIAATALLGLCLFPSAWARLSFQYSSSGCSQSGDKGLSTSGDIVTPHACHPAARRSLEKAQQLCSHVLSSTCRSFRLAPALFDAEEPGQSATCYSRKNRLPRLAVELTPLPRLSLDFHRHRKGGQRLSTSNDGSHSSFKHFSGVASYNSLDLSKLPRMQSGANLQVLAGSDISAPPYEVSSSSSLSNVQATESLGCSPLSPSLEQWNQVISETHLLQVGFMLGESSCKAALAEQQLDGPVGQPCSFYGMPDAAAAAEPWDLLVSEADQQVLYWAWRRPFRKGLYMYMTRSVFLGASPAEVRAFINDDMYRLEWDNSTVALRPLTVISEQPQGSRNSSNSEDCLAALGTMAADSAAVSASNGGGGSTAQDVAAVQDDGALSSNSRDSTAGPGSSQPLAHESAVMLAVVQFPKPMAPRSYRYMRRVWPRPSDGGCYCLSKSCTYPDASGLPGRVVHVEDYCSGYVIRTADACLLPAGYTGQATEVLLVYYEDSHVRPSLANMGVRKGLWPLVQRTEKALRIHQADKARSSRLNGSSSHLQAATQQHPAGRLQPCMSEPASVHGMQPSHEQTILQQNMSVAMQSTLYMPTRSTQDRNASMEANETVESAFAGSNAAADSRSCSSTDKASRSKPVTRTSSSACSLACLADEGWNSSSRQDSSGSTRAKASKTTINWQWFKEFAAGVADTIVGSGQCLAAVSVNFWQCQTRLAVMLPTLEWRLLQWLVHSMLAPGQLLLTGSSSITNSDSRHGLQRVNSHPIADCLHPGLLKRLQSSLDGSCSLLRIPSHPLTVEDDQGESSTTVAARRSSRASVQRPHGGSSSSNSGIYSPGHAATLLNLDWPVAACTAAQHLHNVQSSPLLTSDTLQQVANGCYASCLCGAASCPAGSCSRGSSCDSAHTSSCNSNGASRRVMADAGRQRRVICRLLQASAVRVMHKVLSTLEH